MQRKRTQQQLAHVLQSRTSSHPVLLWRSLEFSSQLVIRDIFNNLHNSSISSFFSCFHAASTSCFLIINNLGDQIESCSFLFLVGKLSCRWFLLFWRQTAASALLMVVSSSPCKQHNSNIYPPVVLKISTSTTVCKRWVWRLCVLLLHCVAMLISLLLN